MNLKQEVPAAVRRLRRFLRESLKALKGGAALTQELLVVLSLRDDRLLRCSRMSLAPP